MPTIIQIDVQTGECIERELTAEEVAAASLAQSQVQPQAPSQVSRFQALAALLQSGLLSDVEAYMALPETDPFVALAWKEAQDFRRDSSIVASVAAVFGMTDSHIDDLFAFAATITG